MLGGLCEGVHPLLPSCSERWPEEDELTSERQKLNPQLRALKEQFNTFKNTLIGFIDKLDNELKTMSGWETQLKHTSKHQQKKSLAALYVTTFTNKQV